MQRLKEHGYIADNLDPAGFYRNLKKMEKDGYVISSAGSGGPKSRKTFTITDFGRRALSNWEESLRKYEKHISHIVYGISKIK
jgi:DNA-binding PadR family transcriptional regulator